MKMKPLSIIISFLFILVIFLVVPLHSAFAALYYVATTGSDTNPGTESSPWKTIQKAANTMVAGDTVYVRAGTYTESGTCGSPNTALCAIKPQQSGTSGARITYAAYPGETVIIDRNFTGYALYILDKNYITISGFEIIRGYPGGIYTGGSTGIIIENNTIHNIGGPAGDNKGPLMLWDCVSCTIKNNKLYDVGDIGDQNSPSMLVFDMENSIIENNEMWNANTGIFHKRGSGIKGSIMRNNIIHDTNLYGIRFSIAGTGDPPHIDHEIYQNIFYNVPTAIIATTRETNPASTGLIVHNNVFHNSNEGIYLYGYKNVSIWNNIFYNIIKSIRTITSGDASINSINLSNFNIFNPNENFDLNKYSPSDVSYTSLTAWQAGTGFDINSLNSSPLFVNYTGRDYHLQASSPAKFAGRVSGVSSGAVVDVGAYPIGNEIIGVNIGGGGPDTTSPSVPQNLIAQAISSTQINLSWTASTDNVGVAGYRVERCQGSICTNFTQIAAPTGTSYSDTGLLASTAYRYQVRAVDAAGNFSGYSSIASATTQAAPPPDINTNLISHWKFDEGSGTIASDASGNSNTFSISGASWTTGQVGGALSFDGNDLAECSDTNCGGTTASGLDMGTRDWTTTAWIKTSVKPSIIISKIGNVASSEPSGWAIGVDWQNGGGFLSATILRNGMPEIRNTGDGAKINDGKWHHVVVVFDRNGNMIRYVDGEQTGTQNSISSYNGQVIDSSLKVRIGARDNTGDESFFSGIIDEVRVYSRALTASEIQMIYNLVISPDVTPPAAPTGLVVN